MEAIWDTGGADAGLEDVATGGAGAELEIVASGGGGAGALVAGGAMHLVQIVEVVVLTMVETVVVTC